MELFGVAKSLATDRQCFTIGYPMVTSGRMFSGERTEAEITRSVCCLVRYLVGGGAEGVTTG